MDEGNPTQIIETLRSEQKEQCLEMNLQEHQNEEVTQPEFCAERQMNQEKVDFEKLKEEIDVKDDQVSGKERVSEIPSVSPPLSNIQIKIDSM